MHGRCYINCYRASGTSHPVADDPERITLVHASMAMSTRQKPVGPWSVSPIFPSAALEGTEAKWRIDWRFTSRMASG